MAARAAAYVNVPAFGRVELGGGHFLYSHDPGYVSFGLDIDFLGVLRISGGVSGRVNPEDADLLRVPPTTTAANGLTEARASLDSPSGTSMSGAEGARAAPSRLA